MTAERRIYERVPDFLPLEIRVVHAPDGQELAGPFSGRIIDISSHGACLLMTQVMSHAFHVFYSTRDTAGAVLQLIIDQPPDIGHHILTARPVWLNAFQQDTIRAFKMGVECIEPPGDGKMQALLVALRKDQEVRAAWWRGHSQRT